MKINMKGWEMEDKEKEIYTFNISLWAPFTLTKKLKTFTQLIIIILMIIIMATGELSPR